MTLNITFSGAIPGTVGLTEASTLPPGNQVQWDPADGVREVESSGSSRISGVIG